MVVRTYLLCKFSQKAGTTTPSLETPFAFANQLELDWTVVGTQPDRAQIEESHDNINFFFIDDVPWNSTIDIFESGWYRVIGKTGGVAITNYSNSVGFGV